VREAEKLGFSRVIIPAHNLGGWNTPGKIEVIGVSTVEEALEYALGG
jgi:DNA repair protein RadA/Sms